MSLVKKLLGMWMIGKTVSSTTHLLGNLLISMAVIAILAAVSAVFFLILVCGILWFSYNILVIQGFTELTAILILGAVVLLVLLLCLYYMRCYIKKISLFSLEFDNSTQSPIVRGVTHIVDSFIKGLTTETPTRK